MSKSKKKVQKRTAIFAITPDGCSIHTMELIKELSGKQFQAIKDALYRENKPHARAKMYEVKVKTDGAKEGKSRVYEYIGYGKNGVNLHLEEYVGKGYESRLLRLVINPRRLIDPKSSYLGILPAKKESVEKVAMAFYKLFKDTPIPAKINDYRLSRIDTCANIRCDSNKLFRELVRVARKQPTPPKLERKYYKHEDKKKANRYNKHYICYACDSRELVIYDKTYQMEHNGLVVDYEDLPKSVLRFEIHWKRRFLQKLKEDLEIKSVVGMLWYFLQESQETMVKHYSAYFPYNEFVPYERMKEKIEDSRFSPDVKARMAELGERMQRTQSVDAALKKMEKKGLRTDDLLKHFKTLGISPIPLRKNFGAARLPGVAKLLRDTLCHKDVTVPYTTIKYK